MVGIDRKESSKQWLVKTSMYCLMIALFFKENIDSNMKNQATETLVSFHTSPHDHPLPTSCRAKNIFSSTFNLH